MDKRKTTEYIYIHHTVTPRSGNDKFYGGDVIRRIRKLHAARGFSDIGYHYVITGEGLVLAGRNESLIGAHTLGHNATSLGISNTGSFVKGGDVMVVGDVQYSALCDIVVKMTRKYNIPLSHILGHLDGQATECPGQIYGLMAMIRNSVELRLRIPESAPVDPPGWNGGL